MAKPARLAAPVLTPNAQLVLERRYLLKNDAGVITETAAELFWRVARGVAEAESSRRPFWANAFFELMVTRRFIPNSPTLMNAGKPGGQLSACFVLPVEDSLAGIFDTLKHAALIHQSGGGTGFDFSRLRPEGSRVRSSQGAASGPVSFIRIFDSATEAIKQGGTRRGANMGILRVDHPDILKFINLKSDVTQAVNFNVSVGITDEFMAANAADTSFSLRDPRTKKGVAQLRARALFDVVVDNAWRCGDPGVVFLDRMNRFNPTPHVAAFEATNPCGEQPLLPFESCNLGSMNLGAYVQSDLKFDWQSYARDVRVATRFLDNVIEVNTYPVRESEEITKRNRKIGLGVMGFADALLLLGVPYDSGEAQVWAEQWMSTLDREAKRASAELAKTRGAFRNWSGSLWQKLGFPKLRNATVSTVAPTGTISMIAGASSGIEPIFSGVFFRNVLSGERLKEIHPSVAALARAKGLDPLKLEDAQLASELGPSWRPAPVISVDAHIAVQAAFQRHSDSAVSKTINLAESATRADVAHAYRRAFELGCKGITVYRDQSRSAQVLERAPSSGESSRTVPICVECEPD